MTTDIVYVWGSYDNNNPGNSFNTPTRLSRLGTGSTSSLGQPCVQINAENGWFSFLNSNGTAVIPFGYGLNFWQQINRTGQDPIFPNPEQVAATSGTGSYAWPGATLPIIQSDGGGEFHIALDTAGNLWSSGTDNHGSLGVNTTTGTAIPIPGQVFGVGDLTGATKISLKPVYGAISGGSDHWVGLQSAGTVVACGSNQYGQCGDGAGVDPGTLYTVPVQVVKGAQAGTTFLGDTTPISYVSVGDKQSMALESGGMHLYTWGRNNMGQLGIGTTVDSSSPVDVTPFLVSAGATLPIVFISGGGGTTLGDGHCIAIDSAGVLFCWGDNTAGQIGTGTLSAGHYSTPQIVSKQWSGTIVAASAGGDHSMALDSGGNLWTWGSNGNGQLGIAAAGPGFFPTPAQVTALPGNLTIDTSTGLTPFAGNQTSVIHGTQPPPPTVRTTNRRNQAGFFVPLTGLGGADNVQKQQFTLSFGGSYPTGSTLFTTTTGTWIFDFFVRVVTAYDGFTPNLDLIANLGGNTAGLLVSSGLSPMPMWVADQTLGNNTGLLTSGPAAGPTATLSFSSGLETLGVTPSSPIPRTPLFVSAGSTLSAVISQDGTPRSQAANVTAQTAPLSLIIGPTNDTFQWTGADPHNGGGGGSALNYTVAHATYANLGALATALNAATHSGNAFNLPGGGGGTFSSNGTQLVLTNLVTGAIGNGNVLSSAASNDIVATLGFNSPSILGVTAGAVAAQQGQGGDPLGTVGQAILTILVVT